MTADQLFANHAALRAQIAADMDNLAALRTVAERRTSQYSVVVGSHAPGGRGRLEDDVLNIVEEEEKLKSRIASLDKLEKEILELIRLVPDDRQRAMLLTHNLQGYSIKQSARRVNMPYTTAYYSVARGIKILDRILKEKEEKINESDADISQ